MEQSVAILMSTYNGEKYLEEQIISLLNQTYANIFIYVRDDGSTDATLAILEKYRSEHFVIFAEENIGVVGSFFELLKLAGEHDYYAFCDQDDVWHNDKIMMAAAWLSEKAVMPQQDVALYCAGIEIVDEKLSHKGFYPQWKRPAGFENAMVQNIAAGLTSVMSAKLRNELVAHMPNIKQIVMHDWWVYLVASALGIVYYDSRPVVKYRQHGANNWGANASGMNRWVKRIYKFLKAEEKGMVSMQLKEFERLFTFVLNDRCERHLTAYFHNQSSLVLRLRYICYTDVYRQTMTENLAFRIAYLLKAY